jgi:hypothetical protein
MSMHLSKQFKIFYNIIKIIIIKQIKIRNLREGDVILLRDKTLYRNEWPVGIVEKAIPSDDNVVRKVEIRVARDRKVYSRPTSSMHLSKQFKIFYNIDHKDNNNQTNSNQMS